jgi:small subunit ribosomal protein S4
MARRGPTERKSRRLGAELGLKGARALRGKSGLARRPYPPGQHGRRRPGRHSDYRQQLHEKQKARFFYGVRESQLRRYLDRAVAAEGPTGEALVGLLETRLDNVVHRLGLATTRAQARQFVAHRHVEVGGRVVDRPSYEVSAGERIGIRPESPVVPLANEAVELAAGPPAWLALAPAELAGTVLHQPVRDEVVVLFDEQAIVEFYSR